jgi:hypothetical protein
MSTTPGKNFAAALAVFALAVAGCGEAPPTAASRAPAPMAAAPAPAPVKPPAAPALQSADVAVKKAAEYKPPFPNRTELFASPNPAAAAKAARRSVVADVTLKGIVRRDVSRALLEIGGTLVHLRENEERSGVRVVSIEHPRVTLQRGEQRWTATLYEPR